MAKKQTKKIISRPRRAGKTTDMRKEAVAAIAGFDWEVIYKSLKTYQEELRRRDFHGYPRDREAFYRDMEELDRLIMKVHKVLNLNRPDVKPAKFTI